MLAFLQRNVPLETYLFRYATTLTDTSLNRRAADLYWVNRCNALTDPDTGTLIMAGMERVEKMEKIFSGSK
jgi:hypothetical protein